uniref:PvLEA23 protein n=1 Tax=Polypedilum vanderplanki TaxID=319348 RepID=S6BNK4_POLVA|nr:PvLEA23 protein [Polypedilum vanderplanki]
MANNKGILEEAAEKISDVKEKTKETFESAKEQIRKALYDDGPEHDASKKSPLDRSKEMMHSVDQTFEETKNIEKEPEKVAQNDAKENVEGAREKLVTPKGELNPEKEKKNFEKNKFYAFQKLDFPFSTQSVTTIFEGVFEPTTSAKVVPVVCTNLKKIIK